MTRALLKQGQGRCTQSLTIRSCKRGREGEGAGTAGDGGAATQGDWRRRGTCSHQDKVWKAFAAVSLLEPVLESLSVGPRQGEPRHVPVVLIHSFLVLVFTDEHDFHVFPVGLQLMVNAGKHFGETLARHTPRTREVKTYDLSRVKSRFSGDESTVTLALERQHLGENVLHAYLRSIQM